MWTLLVYVCLRVFFGDLGSRLEFYGVSTYFMEMDLLSQAFAGAIIICVVVSVYHNPIVGIMAHIA